MLNRTAKTLAKGLSKSRSGSSPIGLQTLIDRATQKGFADRIKKAVSDEEALEAAKKLTEGRRGRAQRYVESAVIGSAANPVIRAVGRATEAAAGAPKGMGSWRAGLARGAVKAITRGELARQIVEGGLAGGGVEALREGLELGKAKKTVKRFMSERLPHREKAAGVEPAPQSRGIPKKKPTDPWRYDPRPAGEF